MTKDKAVHSAPCTIYTDEDLVSLRREQLAPLVIAQVKEALQAATTDIKHEFILTPSIGPNLQADTEVLGIALPIRSVEYDLQSENLHVLDDLLGIKWDLQAIDEGGSRFVTHIELTVRKDNLLAGSISIGECEDKVPASYRQFLRSLAKKEGSGSKLAKLVPVSGFSQGMQSFTQAYTTSTPEKKSLTGSRKGVTIAGVQNRAFVDDEGVVAKHGASDSGIRRTDSVTSRHSAESVVKTMKSVGWKSKNQPGPSLLKKVLAYGRGDLQANGEIKPQQDKPKTLFEIVQEAAEQHKYQGILFDTDIANHKKLFEHPFGKAKSVREEDFGTGGSDDEEETTEIVAQSASTPPTVMVWGAFILMMMGMTALILFGSVKEHNYADIIDLFIKD